MNQEELAEILETTEILKLATKLSDVDKYEKIKILMEKNFPSDDMNILFEIVDAFDTLNGHEISEVLEGCVALNKVKKFLEEYEQRINDFDFINEYYIVANKYLDFVLKEDNINTILDCKQKGKKTYFIAMDFTAELLQSFNNILKSMRKYIDYIEEINKMYDITFIKKEYTALLKKYLTLSQIKEIKQKKILMGKELYETTEAKINALMDY